MKERVARGDKGINPLDGYCKEHDIFYETHSDSAERAVADKLLSSQALKRVFSKDASFGERASALAVTAAMKAKRALSKIGSGLTKRKKNTVSFSKLVNQAKLAIKKANPKCMKKAVKVAIKAAKKYSKGKNVKVPRVLPLPKTGGAFPALVPLFGAISAVGGISSAIMNVVKAIREAKNATQNLKANNNMTVKKIGKGISETTEKWLWDLLETVSKKTRNKRTYSTE